MVHGIRVFVFLSFFISGIVAAAPADFSVSPDNSQKVLLDTIARAHTSLDINIYMITSKALESVLLDRIKAGVAINMLVEAQPFGGKIVSVEKDVLDHLKAAFDAQGKSRLLIMTNKKSKVGRRYVFDHAKYVIIDASIAYISSENFVGSGVMSYPDNKGNRGWEVLLGDSALAKNLLSIFKTDTDTRNSDVVDYDPSLVDLMPPFPQNGKFDPTANRRTVKPFSPGHGEVKGARLCTSPKSLACLTDFIRSAKTSLDIQQLSLPLYWPSPTKEKRVNPLLGEMLSAARRGVVVRVMMSPGRAEDEGKIEANLPEPVPPPYDSNETIHYLREIAKRERIKIDAVEINTEALQLKILHNKGMVADGHLVFLGSINGTENSVNSNREVGVALDSGDAAKYFGEVFNFDWNHSN